MHFDWDSFWGLLWYSLVVFAFIAYLIILFNIIVDLFWRDHLTSGWLKAVWVIFLIVFPYLTALVYLIARGDGMALRARKRPSPRRGKPTTTSSRRPADRRRRKSPMPRGFSTPAPSPKPNSTR